MIKTASIKNLQSHKNSILEFDKGLNVIIGKTDSGKTAIMRALRLVIENRPTGDGFRSNWGGDTSVVIETFEGSEISRIKTKNKNSYELDGMEFLAFGQNIPEEITKALNMDDVNLQQQMEGVFLLSKSPGDIASYFNKIGKLDKIDSSIQFIQKSINTTNQSIKNSEFNVKTYNEKLENFVNLEVFETDLQKVEDVLAQYNTIKFNISSLSNLISLINNNTLKQNKQSILISHEECINELIELMKKKNEEIVEKDKLKNLSLKIYYLGKDINKAENLVLLETPVNDLLKLLQESENAQRELTKLNKLYTSVTNNEKVQERSLKQLKKLEKEFEDKFPDVCPLCETKIK